ncbi:MAG: hypothetical protein KN64_04300 [Sulfurovum sp. AS07-7]|nr:MAG: hypothetical protein KN64_04300 [Sulfurovum sp. AS07-7]
MRFLFFISLLFLFQGCVAQQSQLSSQSISKQELIEKSHYELSIVAKSIHEQESAMSDFARFIDIMKSYVNDYSNTIQASAYFSNALRVLPIPYAGEVSNATKLVSNSLVNLNNTASALDKYRYSSVNFLNGYNQLGRNPNPMALAQLSSYADNFLIIDALNLQANMEKIGKTTEGLLTATQIISTSSTVASSYLDKAKSFLGMQEEVSVEEKEALAKSKDGFKANLTQLNNHINMLKNSAMLNRQGIAKARVISDLAVEVDRR